MILNRALAILVCVFTFSLLLGPIKSKCQTPEGDFIDLRIPNTVSNNTVTKKQSRVLTGIKEKLVRECGISQEKADTLLKYHRFFVERNNMIFKAGKRNAPKIGLDKWREKMRKTGLGEATLRKADTIFFRNP